jgi:riboflavin kinase / FMN adenylyltransferase
MELIYGEVVLGQQYGRKIGYPTANIVMDDLIIEFGVWVSQVLYSKKWYNSISYFSIDSKNTKIFESHIFDFDKEIYGDLIEVRTVQFLRSPEKFDSETELKEQMKKDCLIAKKILENLPEKKPKDY